MMQYWTWTYILMMDDSIHKNLAQIHDPEKTRKPWAEHIIKSANRRRLAQRIVGLFMSFPFNNTSLFGGSVGKVNKAHWNCGGKYFG